MASITQKANGTYLIRVYCGKDEYGKQLVKDKMAADKAAAEAKAAAEKKEA